MGTNHKICKITAILNKGASTAVMDALAPVGITDFHLGAGRAIILQEKKGFLGLGGGEAVVDDPIDVVSFLIPEEREDAALNFIIEKANLDVPGRGSVYSENVQAPKAHAHCRENQPKPFKPSREYTMYSELTGICCIVQRGQGNHVARVALDTGTCAPTITFGHGTGVRDKLGILRITIPAEKEVINIVANADDADAVLNLMVDVGRLDEPGKGFIFQYPVRKGMINTKITRGMPKHAASIEQIISAVDELKGGAGWRQRAVAGESGAVEKRACLYNLVDFTLVCDEGRGEDLVKSAMSVGAAGATISKIKHHNPGGAEAVKVSPAREACNMIIGEGQMPAIIEAIEQAGAFDDNTHGLILTHPAPKACTYLGKKK